MRIFPRGTGPGKWLILPTTYTVEGYISLCPDGLRLGGSLYNSIANLIEGLAYLRELGVAHLDIKPGNIVYTDNVRLHVVRCIARLRSHRPLRHTLLHILSRPGFPSFGELFDA